ncbi:MAG: S1 RNA-binding domain-containing protein, partial [Bryobacteraceae bacterium]
MSVEESTFGEVLSRFEEEHHASAHPEGTPAQTLQGTVIAVSAESVFVDVGRKTEGLLPLEKVKGADGQVTVKAGDIIAVTITGRDSEGYYVLSTVHVERPRDWSHLELAFAEKRIIAGTVVELVKGGVRVDVGARAFMPASRTGVREMADLEKLVGQEIRCRITKIDVANEDLVVDRRSVLEEETAAAKEKAFSDIKEGSVIRGTVRSLTEFGAFVDIGGVDGLLHVTDMSWHRVANPADVVSAGEPIEVKVLKVNAEARRISLGLKQLQPDPWTLALSQFHVGDRVRGTVARLTDFGAFIELAPGVDGLIHVSEMSWTKKIRKPADL